MSEAKALFLRHRAGDSDALPQLVERWSPSLRRLALRMKLTPHAADDAVQETWLAVLRSAATFDGERPFLPWLHALLRHSVANQRRRERRLLRALTMVASAAPDEACDDTAARHEAAACLRAALVELPAGLRRPLALHLLEGLSPKAIAARLGVTQGSVRVLLFRGRRALRRQLPPVLGLAGWFSLRDPRPGGARLAGRSALAAAALVVCAVPTVLSFTASDDVPNVAVVASSEASPASRASADAIQDSATRRESAIAERVLTIAVRDAAERAVPAVAVTIEPQNGTDPRLYRRTAVTDDRGVVHFPAAADVPFLVFTDRGANGSIAARGDRAALRIASARDVVVHAVDGRGVAIADAGVWLGTADDGHGAVVARTDEHGSCTLRAVPPDTTVALFADGHHRTVRTPIGDRATITLRANAGVDDVVVRVLDPRGEPLADALVFGGSCSDGVPSRLPTDVAPLLAPAIRVTTNDAGEARLASLEPGTHPIVVRAPGHAPFVLDVACGTGGRRIVECRLDPAAPVVGRAIDGAGNGIAGARVVLHSEHRSGDVELVTAADGTFVASAPPAAIDEIVAAASETEVVHLPTRGLAVSTPIAVVLPPLPRWSGRVVDEYDVPLAGHHLRFASSETRTARPDRVVTTAADGTFAITAPGNAYCRISLGASDWPVAIDVPSAAVTRHGTELEIVVPRAALPAGRLRGRLLDHDGRPVANRRLAGLLHGVHGDSLPKADLGHTDDAGRFDLGPLPAGRCTLVLDTTNDGSIAGLVGTFPVPTCGAHDVDVVLPPARELLGEFLFEDGDRPATALAVVRLPASDLTIATQPGALRQQLLPGTYSVSVAGEGFAWINDARITVDDDDLHARFALERANPIRLQPGTLPVGYHAGAGLWIRAADGAAPGRTLCRFELEPGVERAPWLAVDLPSGTYVAEVRCASGRIATAPFRVDDQLPSRDLQLRFDP